MGKKKVVKGNQDARPLHQLPQSVAWKEPLLEPLKNLPESKVSEFLRGVPINNAQDPWKHRSANMSCQACMWFVKKIGTRLGFHQIGRRRHAPVMSGYPVVFTNDWCGDHKLDENES